MGKIYTLTFEEYCKLVTDIGLDKMPADTYGLDKYFPLMEISNLKKLHEQYVQRDEWFEEYLNTEFNFNSKSSIIWGEAARFGNGKYVYSQDKNANFKFKKLKTGYFENVSEEIFGKSVVIDFFSPFGLNHTKSSRDFLNKKYSLNFKYYNIYLHKYIKSIFDIINISSNNLFNYNNVITAPKKSRNSILTFFMDELKIINEVKCYNINTTGKVSVQSESLDIVKVRDQEKSKKKK